jgi:serine/threonine protein kinase
VDLLRKMMTYDPAERATAVQSLRHEFFSQPDQAKPAADNGVATAEEPSALQ